MTPVVAADSIERSFGQRAALRSAYVDAAAGAVTALVGVSGSGKTTLLEILAGRLRAHGGQVRWNGERVARPTPAALAQRGLVYAPDHPWISTRVSVARQLALAARVWDSDADAIARELHVAGFMKRRTAQLSTGERRLGALAVACACRPAALVLDEPFRDLEPLHRETVARLLASQARGGVAVLFADHDATMVAEIADRLFAIEDGRTRAVAGFRDMRVVDWYRGWQGQAETDGRVDG